MRSLLLCVLLSAACIGLAFADDAPPAGDPAAGKTVFQKCAGCHSVGPGAINKTGPILNGIVGQKAGAVPGYAFSDAMKNSGVTWNEATLAAYLQSPRSVIAGTRMTFGGLSRPADVANVIAYLKTFRIDGSPAQ